MPDLERAYCDYSKIVSRGSRSAVYENACRSVRKHGIRVSVPRCQSDTATAQRAFLELESTPAASSEHVHELKDRAAAVRPA
jgi:hypothetical protein